MFVLRLSFSVLLLGLISAAMPFQAAAREFPSLGGFFNKFAPAEGHSASSSGFSATESTWSFYASTVIALNAPLHRDGWQLKFAGHYGSYRYDSRRTVCRLSAQEMRELTGANLSKLCADIMDDPPKGEDLADLNKELAPAGLEVKGNEIEAVHPHQGTYYYFGVMPGYQAQLGKLVVRAFLGPALEHHKILPADPTHALSGMNWGVQGAIETWLPLGSDGWLSANGSYFTGTSSYSATGRLGYEPFSWMAVGPELATYGDEDDMSGRAGGFLQLDIDGVQTTLAAGISGAYRSDPGAYGSASVYWKF